MAYQTASGVADLTRSVVFPNIVDSVFKNSHFIGKFTTRKDEAGDAYIVNANVATHTAATRGEGDSISAGTANTFVACSFSFTEFEVEPAISNTALRALGGGRQAYSGQGWDWELKEAARSLKDLINTTFLADAATGLLGQIDDDTTAFGGQSRATYTSLQSSVTAVGGALSRAAMHGLEAAMALKGSPKPYAIFTGPAMIENYLGLVTSPVPNQGGNQNAWYAFADATPSGNNMIFSIPDFVTTEMAYVPIAVPDMLLYVNHTGDQSTYASGTVVEMALDPGQSVGTIHIEDVASATNTDTVQKKMIHSGALVVPYPHWCGKLETLTA